MIKKINRNKFIFYSLYFLRVPDLPDMSLKKKRSRAKEVATAILTKKKAPHKLLAEEAKNDDNTAV